MQGRRLVWQWCLGFSVLLVLAGCTLLAPHYTTTPDRPVGPTVGLLGEDLFFSVTGAACTRSHAVMYELDWGDGTSSEWTEETVVAHAWVTLGVFMVKVRARCQEDGATMSSCRMGLRC
jgi:hypothetical protein